MIIHIVENGDTLTGIAARYGVKISNLAADNGLSVVSELVVGQALVILIPSVVHTVRRGETLFSIASSYGTTVINLLRNNMRLGGVSEIRVGEEIIISYDTPKSGKTFAVNSYAYPYIDSGLLRSQMPYLTYFTPFTYGISNFGRLVVPSDAELLRIASEYGADTLLHLSTLTENGTFSSNQADLIFDNSEVRVNIIDEIVSVIKEKGYKGADVDFEFIDPRKRYDYISFLQELRLELEPLGLPLFSALAPKVSDTQSGVLYEGHDYAGIGAAVNYVLLMTYEWGYTYGPPMAVAPLPSVKRVVDYALTKISSSKIFMGIPTYGYDWVLPYERDSGVGAPSISPIEAIDIARKYRADIRYDQTAKAPWFVYTDDDGRLHEVWFEDARSVIEKFRLAEESGIYGLGYWNSMREFPQNWVVLNAMYNILNNSLM